MARTIPWVEGKTGLKLAPSQIEALTLAVRTKVLVITGGPGVGKTTLVNSILKVLGAKGVRVALERFRVARTQEFWLESAG